MKIFIGLAAVLTAVSASAQTTVSGTGMNSPNYSSYVPGLTNRGGIVETPTMQAEKLKRAIALRTEVSALVKSDGGKLSPGHEAYVRRKACQILGKQSATIGTLVPPRHCSI
ncbi:hypothetical protein ABIC16_000808 [Sphingomonas sp. PvP055]|uniref:hypothetical protein n=1 Tax=Sphingomonas sp. PvP055 TaxID=3156391 RepID=UPI003391F14B